MADALKPDKHGRDHCPGGEDPIPCFNIQIFRAAYYSSPVDNIAGTRKNVDWENWISSSDDVFQPRNTTDSADAILGTDNARIIRLKKPGRYTFVMGHHFTTSGSHVLPSGVQIGYSDESGLAPAVVGYPDDVHTGPVTQYNSLGYVTGVLIRTYPYWDHGYGGTIEGDWPDFTTSAFVPWYANIACNMASGTARADEGYLEIQFEAFVNYPVAVP